MFVDANVLIAAARVVGPVGRAALAVLDNPSNRFAASDFLRLEVLPKATHAKRIAEAAFYRQFFGQVAVWAIAEPQLVSRALSLAERFGLSAMDALHAAAAISTGSEAFITGEKPGKPICRVAGLRVWPLMEASI
ncbi:MAG: PIN domain-containing protein [Rhodospirillales bacterium]